MNSQDYYYCVAHSPGDGFAAETGLYADCRLANRRLIYWHLMVVFFDVSYDSILVAVVVAVLGSQTHS